MLYRKIYLAVVLLLGVAEKNNGQTVSNPPSPINYGINGAVSTQYLHQTSMEFTSGFSYTPGAAGAFFVAEINDRILTPAATYSPGGTSSRTTLDLAKAIGSIEGTTTVTEQGQLNYNIPIFTSPVAGDLVPDIQIHYSGGKNPGLLGIGWDIQGITTITRSSRSLFLDGNVEGVTYTNSDPFTLDGQKLIPISGSNGASGTLYGSRSEDFNQVISNGVIGNGPEWFLIRTRSGLEIEVGRTADSRLAHNGTILIWKINKITDFSTGNYMNFNYRNDGNEIAIDRIDYGGNASAGLMPYNSIDFYYSKKADASERFISGKRLSSTLILTSVKSRCEGVAVRILDFQYAFDENSKLVNITESSKSGEQKNATVVDWETTNYSIGTPDAKWNNSPAVPLAIRTRVFAKGDFNGDGLDDFVVDDGVSNAQFRLKVKIQKESAIGEYYEFIIPGILFNRSFGGGGGNSGYSPNLSVLDFDNDGKDEVYVKLLHATLASYNDYGFPGFAFDGSTMVGITNTITNQILVGFAGNTVSQDIMTIVPSDIDGDGNSEAVFLNQSSPDHIFIDRIMEYNAPTLGTIVFNVTDPGSPFSWGAINTQSFVIDFNGNGRADFCIKRDHIITIVEYNPNTYVLDVLYQTIGSINAVDRIYFGDFNGDGNSDLIVYNETVIPVQYKVYLSTGTAFALSPEFSSVLGTYQVPGGILPTGGLQIVDFNNDGKSDVILATKLGPPLAFIYISNGTSFIFKMNISSFSPTAGGGYDPMYSSFMDIDGDGLIEHCSGAWTYNTTIKFGGNSYKGGYLVTSIVNGLNVRKDYNYGYVKVGNANGAYSKGTTSYPCPVKSLPILLVTGVNTKHHATNTPISSMEYSYRGAAYDRTKNGFLGFFQVDRRYKKNNALKQLETTSYAYNGTFSLLYPYSKNSYLNGSTNYEFAEEYTFAIVDLGGGRYWRKLTTDYEYDGKKNVGTTTTYSYDGSGYINQISTNNGYSTTTNTRTYTTINSFMSKVLLETITKSNTNANSTVTEQTKYWYDGYGRVAQSLKYPTLPKNILTEYTYNNLGVPTGVGISSPGLPTVVNGFVYDYKGRFVLKEFNALGQLTERMYHPELGKVIWEKTPDGLVTTYDYNTWGNMTLSTDVYGQQTTYLKFWTSPNTNMLNYYGLSITKPNDPGSTVYYDILDNKTKESTRNDLGNIVNIDYTYDNGLLKSYTKPYKAGEMASIIEYSYDNMNRVKTITDASRSLVTTNTYTPPSVKVDVQGGLGLIESTTTEYNNDGTVKKITDLSGTVNYKYKGNGKISEISSSSGTITSVYDNYGNQIQLNDPNAGTTNYQYDAYGQLVSESDAAGNSFLSVYDVMGRLISKKDVTANKYLTYSYKTSGNGLNKIALMQDYDGGTKTYNYDDRHRLSSVVDNVEGTQLSTSFGYQNEDVVSVTYPEGYSIGYVRNNVGAIQSIQELATNKTLWQLTEVNAVNQPKVESLQNGIKWVRSYNSNLLETSQLNDVNNNNIFSWNYGFDLASGNLMWRKDNLSSMVMESFSYDNMQRLIEDYIDYVDVNGDLQRRNVVTTFYANGNIKYKSDVSPDTYQYGSQPNAVTNITNPWISIPSFDQQIGYNSRKLVNQLSEQNKQLFFTYGPDQERSKTVLYVNGQKVNEHYYSGNYEKEVTASGTKHSYYIYSPYGLLGINIKNNGNEGFYYAYTDYLGTILGLTTADGTIAERFSVDAWGRKRNTEDWGSENYVYPGVLTSRCFTGHEHLEDFGLINMNARLYDPVLARMLSPDNFIQAPQYSQNLNRYSYAFNNPLKYLDPTGNTIIGGIATNYSMRGGVGVENPFYDGSTLNDFERKCAELEDLNPPRGGSGGTLGEGESINLGALRGRTEIIDPKEYLDRYATEMRYHWFRVPGGYVEVIQHRVEGTQSRLDLGFVNTSGDNANYNWTQTFQSNHPRYGKSPDIDKAPLYNDAYSADLPGDYTATFSDSPGLTILDFPDFHVFIAELSLVRQPESGGAYKPIITFTHGVVVAPQSYGGTTTILPLRVITPSAFHLNSIPKR